MWSKNLLIWDSSGGSSLTYEGCSKNLCTFIFSLETVKAGEVVIGRVWESHVISSLWHLHGKGRWLYRKAFVCNFFRKKKCRNFFNVSRMSTGAFSLYVSTCQGQQILYRTQYKSRCKIMPLRYVYKSNVSKVCITLI